jgi:putative ribosome biogenesis GTPase RsgA
MNVLKNFEAVFVVTVALACSAAYSLDRAPVDTNTAAAMPTVVVSAKRLTAEQKQQSLREERATALAAGSSKEATI